MCIRCARHFPSYFSLLTSHVPVGTNTDYSTASIGNATTFVHDEVEETYTPDTLRADVVDAAEECWHHHFICPSQVRCFGDRGSFVGFFDPLGGDEAMCATNNIAPFGPMVIWRVMSSYACAEGCGVYDTVLEEGVTSMQMLFIKDPYLQLRAVGSDQNTGGVVQAVASGRQRRHSL